MWAKHVISISLFQALSFSFFSSPSFFYLTFRFLSCHLKFNQNYLGDFQRKSMLPSVLSLAPLVSRTHLLLTSFPFNNNITRHAPFFLPPIFSSFLTKWEREKCSQGSRPRRRLKTWEIDLKKKTRCQKDLFRFTWEERDARDKKDSLSCSLSLSLSLSFIWTKNRVEDEA